jgi:hypothetical protein
VDRVQGNGQAIAVVLAASVASFVLGLLTILAEGSTSIHDGLQLIDRVGPLSGKVIWAMVAFAVSWAALAAVLRTRELKWTIPLAVAGVLLVASFILTLPPVFQSVA